MTPREQAGQVLMTAGTVAELQGLAGVVRRYSLAGVMVRGRSSAGTKAVAAALRPVRAAAPHDLPLLVATDQEGGDVQVLSGAGFSTIPSAVDQAGWTDPMLEARARGWGRALVNAGVNLDLAPVADTPCASTERDNPPVADLDRNYGDDPGAAGRSVAAVVRGLGTAGVATIVKHFPGLGCVRENTDTTEHVVDRALTTGSSRLQPFEQGIEAGASVVMVSSATYARIDPSNPALFSAKVLDLLRSRLGFEGVVMSDDVGGAAALKPWTPGERVTKFVQAGGDLMLDIVPDDVDAMSKALVRKAADDRAFAARLREAAVRVVTVRLTVTH